MYNVYLYTHLITETCNVAYIPTYIGMTCKKMAANRKGIGPTTLKRTCNSTTNTHTKYLSVVIYKTLQRLTNLRPEGEQDSPNLPDCSSVTHNLYKLHRANSNTNTSHSRLVPLHIKEDT